MRALAAACGLVLAAAPWLHWYGPGNFLVLFGALDRIDPLAREPRSAWEEAPVLAAGLTLVAAVIVARALAPRLRRFDRVLLGAAVLATAGTVLAMVVRPRPEMEMIGGAGEAPLRAGGWVALGALAVFLVVQRRGRADQP